MYRSSTPARAKRLAPRPDGPLTHFASPCGETYRLEVFLKPYRIIYRVREDDVYVLVIADGRRNMRALLEQRLLQA